MTSLTEIELKERMDKHFPKVKEFFSKIDIKGTPYERACTVVDFLQRGSTDRFFCYTNNIDSSIHCPNLSQFENNGYSFIIGTLSSLKKINDFKRKVILAIDSAELKGGTVGEKMNRFVEVFPERVNILVYNSTNAIGRYFTFCWGCHFEEKRKDITYEAWL